MKQKVILTFLGLVATLSLVAAPITPQEALERLGGLSTRTGKVGVSKLEKTPAYTAKTPAGKPAAYIFNATDGQGYKVLSADNSAYVVLGYSDTGYVDPDNMSPEMEWWLSEIGRQIEYNTSRGLSTSSPVAAPNGNPAIPIQIKSKWDQGRPFNDNCPKIGTRACYTGCVATSMAQVMNYHKYPEKGTGTNKYFWSNGTKELSLDFSTITFDWNNMLDVYQYNAYNTTQATAVADLMYACGMSVNMGYGTNASGTQGVLIANALRKFFNYDGNCHADFRTRYSAQQWDQMVYDNLKNVGPIIFNGHPYEDSGHSFVCDGYDGKGYYHFNWGWSGLSDGYYLLESMNPDAQGTGGAESTGFVYGLNGIFGIQKPTGEPVVEIPDNMIMYGGCYAEISGRQLSIYSNKHYPNGWHCGSDHEIYATIGVIFEPIDGTSGNIVEQAGIMMGNVKFKLAPGYYWDTNSGPTINIPRTLPTGKYKVTVAVKDQNDNNNPYVPIYVSYPCPNYFYLDWDMSATTGTVTNVEDPKLSAENLELKSPLYYSKSCMLEATFKNATDMDLTESYAAALLIDGSIKLQTAGIPCSVSKNSTQTIQLFTKFNRVNGATAVTQDTEFTLALINPLTSEVIGEYGKVIMKKSPGSSPLLQCTRFEVEGIEPVSQPVPGGTYLVYDVPSSPFTATLEYNVFTGYFDGTLTVNVLTQNPENPDEMMPLLDGIYADHPFMNVNESKTVQIPVEIPNASVDNIYLLRATYTSGNKSNVLDNLYFKLGSSGIADIDIDSETPARYFNLQGIEISSPAKGQIVIVKKGNKTTKVKY